MRRSVFAVIAGLVLAFALAAFLALILRLPLADWRISEHPLLYVARALFPIAAFALPFAMPAASLPRSPMPDRAAMRTMFRAAAAGGAVFRGWRYRWCRWRCSAGMPSIARRRSWPMPSSPARKRKPPVFWARLAFPASP